MGEGFDIGRDIRNDSRQDVRSGVAGDARADYGDDLTKDTGVDLNDGTGDVSGVIGKESTDDNVGEDLNDAGTEQLDSVLDNFGEDKWSDLSLEEQK